MMKVVHCKVDSYDVYIGRPSIWGNPFTHKDSTIAGIKLATRLDAINAYENWLLGLSWNDFEQSKRNLILSHLHELYGKTLGCWCHPQACHGDVLIKLLENIYGKKK
jgi:hypothetical protein